MYLHTTGALLDLSAIDEALRELDIAKETKLPEYVAARPLLKHKLQHAALCMRQSLERIEKALGSQ